MFKGINNVRITVCGLLCVDELCVDYCVDELCVDYCVWMNCVWITVCG
jgi:hypothetical protein